MATTNSWIPDPARIQPGEHLEVWGRGHLRHTDTVSHTAPGVLWILEAATGIPKLIPAQDYRLRHAPLTRTA